MRKLNLTKHGIEALPTPQPGLRVSYYDVREPGLGVMVQPTGSKMFFWFRKVRGRRTWRTIGDFPDLTVENARDRAKEFNTQLARWKASSYDGPSPFERHGDPTLSSILEDYITKHVRARAKKPDKAEKGYRWMADKYLNPLLNRRLGQISRQDVRQLHDEIGKKHGQVTANRVIKLIKTLFYRALKTEQWHGTNPAALIELFPEKSRDRFLLPNEAPAFLTALKNEPNKDLRDFTVLALFTAARMSDILAMRWQDVSLERALWLVPDESTKEEPYTIELQPEALEILKERHTENGQNAWVFPSHGKTGHLVTVKRSWKGLLKRAGISDLRRHDMRRTHGSWMAMQGASLPVIAKALGHKSIAVTSIYSRLSLAPVREAQATAIKALLTAGEAKPQAAEPKPRKPRQRRKK